MKTIYCPLIGYVQFEPELVLIINTRCFQRLRHIKQTGVAHYVFPGATHTRFEHSLAVAYLAEKMVNTLETKQSLGLNPLVFKLAGLCHDLGHGPLSHAFDHYLHENGHAMAKHEVRSVEMLRRLTCDIPIDKDIVETACELIEPTLHNLPLFWYEIVANHSCEVDVDKFDYIRRDSARTGVPHDVDISRFIEYATVVDSHICYPRKLAYDLHYLFSSRHHLHERVYQHPAVRSIEYMLTEIFVLIGSSCDMEQIEDFIPLTDTIFERDSIELRHCTGKITAPQRDMAFNLLDRIERRDLYTLICDVNVHIHIEECPDYMIVDNITIGYSKNPLLSVKFYDGSAPYRLNAADYSMFPQSTQDFRGRIYVKEKNKIEDAIKILRASYPDIA